MRMMSKNLLANHQLDLHLRTEFLYTLCRQNRPSHTVWR
jgi:hypothetical protein